MAPGRGPARADALCLLLLRHGAARLGNALSRGAFVELARAALHRARASRSGARTLAIGEARLFLRAAEEEPRC